MDNTTTGFLWSLAFITIAAAWAGWLAQGWKRRNGIAWGAGTFIVLSPLLFYVYATTAEHGPELYKDVTGWAVLGFMVALTGAIVMLIAIAALPKPKQ
ncbi:hypothetical protein [Bradyrhizobium sp. CCBAU 45389]|uniref:hypothetical protein n=1 Tax=Bradyrhizobium sp. CCBAU 45389 TaxID=858429 RepID=UPI0023051C14|nr:hypothetical protein [Bradyrhizobium sp. CCBAU 45389]MDA9400522.1 hypothetical protein [Bradyrhizobium sp. CCBAU 45389]